MLFWTGFAIGFVVSALVGVLGLSWYLARTWGQ